MKRKEGGPLKENLSPGHPGRILLMRLGYCRRNDSVISEERFESVRSAWPRIAWNRNKQHFNVHCLTITPLVVDVLSAQRDD